MQRLIFLVPPCAELHDSIHSIRQPCVHLILLKTEIDETLGSAQACYTLIHDVSYMGSFWYTKPRRLQHFAVYNYFYCYSEMTLQLASLFFSCCKTIMSDCIILAYLSRAVPIQKLQFKVAMQTTSIPSLAGVKLSKPRNTSLLTNNSRELTPCDK